MATKPFYIHQKPPAQSFIRLPNFLFEAPSFCSLSSEAKLLYAMILRRTDLSRKNGWADDYAKGCPSLGHPFLSQYGGRMFCPKGISPVSENKKNLIRLAAPHLLRLFDGRITLIIAEIQSLLKFIRTNYFKDFICQ